MEKIKNRDIRFPTAIIGFVFAIFILIWLGYEIIQSTPIKCHYEYGTIQYEWKDNNYYYINFINREGHNRTIWLSDRPPDRINQKIAVLKYKANTNEDLILNWCYIPSIDKERIRGAWRR